MLLKPRIPHTVANLAIAVFLASYLLYGFVSMPPDLEETDVLFWVYAKGKVVHGLSSLGGYVGMGHPATLYRKLRANLDDPIATNHSQHIGMNVSDDAFKGVDVRIYQPHNTIRNGPAIVFFHGGLWISGSIENHDHLASHMAKTLGVLLISVDYRLAPEHPYPAPLDDCYAVTEHVLMNAEQLNVAPSKVALFGIGAGANLAAAVALRLKMSAPDLPTPALQILINPLLQALDFNTPSYCQNQHDASFPKSQAISAWLWYARGWDAHNKFAKYASGNYHTSAQSKQSKMAAYVDHNLLHRKLLHDSYTPNQVDFGHDDVWNELRDVFSDEFFAPLLAPDLRGLPRAYIVASQYDVARDDAMMYAKRLEKAAVPVSLAYYERAIHDMLTMNPRVQMTDKMIRDLDIYLLQNF